MQIELRPHVGIQRTPLGDVEITHPQYIVLAEHMDNVVHVGYVGTQPGAPFNGLETFTRLPPPIQFEIVRQVNEKLGSERKVFSTPEDSFPDEDEEQEESE